MSGTRTLERLTVAVERHGATCVVSLAGDLDLAHTQELRHILANVDGSHAELVLDLARVRFIDTTGLHLLVEQHCRARDEGFTLRLAGPEDGAVAELLAACGLDDVLGVA